MSVEKSNKALRGNRNLVFGRIKYYSSKDTINVDPELAIVLLVLKGRTTQTTWLLKGPATRTIHSYVLRSKNSRYI